MHCESDDLPDLFLQFQHIPQAPRRGHLNAHTDLITKNETTLSTETQGRQSEAELWRVWRCGAVRREARMTHSEIVICPAAVRVSGELVHQCNVKEQHS